MFRRIGVQKGGWQFPQGGVGKGESDQEAMFRELEEEIGTHSVKIIKESNSRIKYKFPQWILDDWKRMGRKSKYMGQKQRWYLVELDGDVDSIHFNNQPQEFDKFKWVPIKKVEKRVIPFKQNAYRKGLKVLGLLD